MAGKAKQRDFSPFTVNGVTSDILGVAKYDVKLPNGNSQSTDIVGPVSYSALVAYLSGDTITEKERIQAYTFFWRGKESMAAQKIRLLNDTVVTIPGTSQSLDLMAIPVSVACQAINAHDLGIKVLAAAAAALAAEEEDTDEEELDEDSERAARKNRAWDNARRFLLESNKVILATDGSLMVNPDYSAPSVSGSSDAVDIMEILSAEVPTKRKRK
jgi:hypothetical protein